MFFGMFCCFYTNYTVLLYYHNIGNYGTQQRKREYQQNGDID